MENIKCAKGSSAAAHLNLYSICLYGVLDIPRQLAMLPRALLYLYVTSAHKVGTFLRTHTHIATDTGTLSLSLHKVFCFAV